MRVYAPCRACSLAVGFEVQGVGVHNLAAHARLRSSDCHFLFLLLSTGKFVGGGDETVALAASGELKRLVESA